MDRHIGAQLYSTREPMKTLEGFESGIKTLKDIGYSVVQVSGIPLAAKDMKKILDDYGMTAALSHRGYNDFKNNLDEVMEYNATLGLDSCCVGMAPVELLGTKDGVLRFVEEVNEISDKLAANGFFFGYHNHCAEFAKYDGKTVMDMFCEETDPKKTKLVVDTFWLQAGGVDPAKFIREHADRAEFIHFKDYIVPSDDLFGRHFAEIGQGNLDWPNIIAACDEAGARIAMVEQDDCYGRDPFESLKMSYDYLKGLGFC